MERDGLAQDLCGKGGQRELARVGFPREGRDAPGDEDSVSVEWPRNRLLVPTPPWQMREAYFPEAKQLGPYLE